MGWMEIVGWLFKLIGQVIELHSKGELTREHLDAMVASLPHGGVPPPK